MYKLVVVGGSLRGQEFSLEEGVTRIGRSHDCEVSLSLDGLSKEHARVTVSGDSIFLEDLKSSNGTLVNGKNITSIHLNANDKISFPGLVIQVVYVKEKKIIVKKKIVKASSQSEEDDNEVNLFNDPMPESPIGKIIWFYKNKLMKVFHGFNEEYEWRVMLGICVAIFITITIALTIFPVMRTSQGILLAEVTKRGTQYVNEVKRLNTTALASQNLNEIRTDFLEEKGSGVYSYELLDLDQRIIAPASKRNKFTNDSFSVRAVEYFQREENKDRPLRVRVGSGRIGVARAIKAFSVQKGYEEVIGVIAIVFAPASLAAEIERHSQAFLEAWTTSAIIAILFFGIIYFLTIRPFQEMRIQIEQALRGSRKQIETKYLLSELNPLKQTINSMIQRIRELQNEDGDDSFAEMEDDSKYVAMLDQFMRGSDGPVMILNSSQEVHAINSKAEDLTGIREASAKDSAIDDVSRDPGLSATIMSLCDQSSNNDGTSQSESYEIGGNPYEIYITAMVGKDTFAKAFYVSFVKEE